jgi:hypothetical protein
VFFVLLDLICVMNATLTLTVCTLFLQLFSTEYTVTLPTAAIDITVKVKTLKNESSKLTFKETICSFIVVLKPKLDIGFVIIEVSKSHTIRHTHIQSHYDSSVRVISCSQRPLSTRNTANTRDEHPCPQRDSKTQPQQSSGFTPST